MDGWLWKKGDKGIVKTFKKRFCRVVADRILYAEDPSKLATAPAGFIGSSIAILMDPNNLMTMSFRLDMSTVVSFSVNDSHTSRKMPGRGFELATNNGTSHSSPSLPLASQVDDICLCCLGRIYILIADNESEFKKWRDYIEGYLSRASVQEDSTEPSLLQVVASNKATAPPGPAVLLILSSKVYNVIIRRFEFLLSFEIV